MPLENPATIDSQLPTAPTLLPTPSLRNRIYLTVSVLVALCLLSTLIGWWGQSKLLEQFQSYEQSEVQLVEIASMDRDVEELKTRAEKYLQTGAMSQLSRAKQLHVQLKNQIASALKLSQDEQMQATLQAMNESLAIFAQRLDLASTERELRTRLIKVELPKQDFDVTESLQQLESAILADDREDLFKAYLRLVKSQSNSRQLFQQYFTEPDSVDFTLGLQSIRESRQALATIRQLIQDDVALSESTFDETLDDADFDDAVNNDEAENANDGPTTRVNATLDKLERELNEFRRLGSRAVQATRGYMFYSNVVMAGEISEFVYRSKRLKDYSEDQRVINRQSMAELARRSRIYAMLASVAAAAFAILMAMQLTYLIVNPIFRITETFRQLGQGDSVSEIPLLNRKDEIGKLAQAAQVFSDKNQVTKQLLLMSEKMTQELAAKASALEETNLELDNFAYVASHDLRSPLRGIKHLASWIQEDCEDLLPEGSKAHLIQMNERATKMENLLDDLLQYSRAGRMNLAPETVDINDIVSSIVSMIDLPKGFSIELPQRSLEFTTMKTPLTQVLLNLITNGVKYNDKGSSGRITVSAENVGDTSILIQVSDNGRGIAPEHLNRVFEMYQRVATDVEGGSGMGLAIVKKLIAKYGSNLKLTSEEGKGSVFSFQWNRVQTPS
ncbi:Sensor protein ZraS [Rubripirellula amarantea]|uniref:histidine kinase n=1 Tax=Rubripirellula amarantea TaxID=2527999 RepID=A0A5C5WHT4_9BACT|nr:ATP-binding protein [Rubripirellula amarantea]TWT50230.1 Sensor protein ZraS [Rubripirellula amarantea]